MINGNIQYNGITDYTNTSISKTTNKSDEIDSIFGDDDINVVAHRGDCDDAPENTIPAYELAAENGYDAAECDIAWTEDNVPVLLHDSTINRTTRNKFGFRYILPRKCSKMTYEELQKYDFGSWFGKDYKGTKIPTFDELLECSKENDLNLYVELKERSGFDEERAQILIEAAEEAGVADKITWISFDESYLEIMKELIPDARLGYLSRDEVSEETIEILDSLKTGENEVFPDIKSSKISEEGSRMLDEAGYDFEAWTIDDTADLEYLADLDCKGITTNSLSKEEVEEVFSYND